MTAAVAVEGLVKAYGDVTALDGLDLEIADGERFGLLGPNGAGKSTLVHVLSTLLSPTAGKAFVYGHSVETDPDAVRSRVGVVFQSPAVDAVLTAREHLALQARLYGLGRRERTSRIEAALDLVDLAERADDRVGTYSGGMKRRLEIARGLVHRPRVLFLDEPTLGLDPPTRRRVWHYVRRLNRTVGVTVVLTTHYLDEAEAVCDRVGVLDGGSLAAVGPPAALKAGAGGRVVTLTVEGDRAAFRDRLSGHEWVEAVETEAGTLRVTVDDPGGRIPSLVREAVRSGAAVVRVEAGEPSLEDAFLELTGGGTVARTGRA